MTRESLLMLLLRMGPESHWLESKMTRMGAVLEGVTKSKEIVR